MKERNAIILILILLGGSLLTHGLERWIPGSVTAAGVIYLLAFVYARLTRLKDRL